MKFDIIQFLLFVNWHSVEPTKIGHNLRKKLRKFHASLVIFKDFSGFQLFSSAKKIERPILANLPTYYVPISSSVALPSYLPTTKWDVTYGRSLM